MARKLVLNIAPIQFEDAEIDVEVHGYESKEQLDALRARTRGSHVVRRDGGTRILCAPVVPGAASTGGTVEKVGLQRQLGLATELTREALINYFRSYERVIVQREPLTFFADGPDDEFLAPSLPEGTSSVPWLSCRVVYKVSIRYLAFAPSQGFVALAVDVRTRQVISVPCEDLLREGISPLGFYVGRQTPPDDPRLAPRFELVGRVSQVVGNMLLLQDAREGWSEIAAKDAWLDPRIEAFDYCLERVYGSRARQIGEALRTRRSSFASGDRRLSKTSKLIDWLGRRSFELVPGIHFRVGDFLREPRRGFPPVKVAPPPVFVFDPTGARTAFNAGRGLHEHGPYSAATFTPNRPRIAVICQRALKGRVEQFLFKLLNGIPAAHGPAIFSRGLVTEYRLEGCHTEFFVAEGPSADAYHRATQKAIEYATDKDLRWDLALVQTYESTHDMRGADNPYLVTKAGFLAQNVPTQEFEIETADAPENQLRYILSNMALATYAKLNGVPWLLKGSPTIAHELVIGLGSAQIGEGRLGARRRFVGITTVFSGDGNYWLSNLSEAVSFEEYPAALLSSLRRTIEYAKRSLNWQPRDHIRLIFHAFKPIKDVEAAAVVALVRELGDYDVETSFIHLVEDHPFVLFDEAQPGVPVPGTRELKGILAPTRGSFLQLSKHELLLSLTGAKELKQPGDGMPTPLLMRLHRSSSFQDLTYLARQAFAFSCHSWRSFLPAPRPVTILYSDLVAHLLSRLEAVPRWNPDCMLGRVGRTRWFL